MTAGTGVVAGVRLARTELSREIRARVAASAAALTAAGRPPRLTVVVATTDGSTAWYVRSIAGAPAKVGIACDVVHLGDEADGRRGDRGCPPPAQRRPGGARHHPADAAPGGGRLRAGGDGHRPPQGRGRGEPAQPRPSRRRPSRLPAGHRTGGRGAARALRHPAGRPHRGGGGRSTVVGKPLAHLLLDRDATVTVCHSRTADLVEPTRRADVLVAAVGRPGLIGSEHVGPGAVVIDVGTNVTDDGGLVGDVDPAVEAYVAGLTPVPGGVGPVTTALLLEHTVRAAEEGNGLR